MRDFVNKKSKLLQPSGIRKFFDIVRETEGAISLGVGEPDFVTPWKVRSAAITSLQRGYTQYTGNRGLPQLLDLISRYLKERFGLEFDPKHILVTIGGSEAIDLALRACIESGEEVLVPDPAYVSYAPLVTMADGVAVHVECREEDNHTHHYERCAICLEAYRFFLGFRRFGVDFAHSIFSAIRIYAHESVRI